MADPVLVTCTQGQWTKVATAVMSGQIWRKDSTPHYLHTIRDTGGTPPDALDLNEEGVHMFVHSQSELIQDDSPIDIYIYALGADGVVRVDV